MGGLGGVLSHLQGQEERREGGRQRDGLRGVSSEETEEQ